MSSEQSASRHARFAPGEEIVFSSLVEVPMTGVNWGTSRHPVTHLQKGTMIHLEITGIDSNRNFVIQPPATKELWGGRVSQLSKMISTHLNATQASESSFCGCLLDGFCFAYTPDVEGAAPMRCRLKSREVQETVDDMHWSITRTVQAYLIDHGVTQVVPVCRLRHLPEDAAIIPAQAAVASWKFPGDRGSFKWTQEDWDEFMNYTVNRNFKGKVLKMSSDLATGRIGLQIELCHYKTRAALYPQDKFWEISPQPSKY